MINTPAADRKINVFFLSFFFPSAGFSFALKNFIDLDETWELDFLQTALYVEESYLSMGDKVEEGTAVFKVSDKFFFPSAGFSFALKNFIDLCPSPFLELS